MATFPSKNKALSPFCYTPGVTSSAMNRLYKGLLFLLVPFALNTLLQWIPLSTETTWGLSQTSKQWILSSVIYSVVPIGVYYIATRNRTLGRLRRKPAYQHLSEEQLRFLDNFSWSAYMGWIFWPFIHRKPHYFIYYLIPIYNIYWTYKIAIDGRKMIWEQNPHHIDKLMQKEVALEVGMTLLLASTGLWVLF